MNAVVDVVVMSVHALFNGILLVLEDALKTSPWLIVTIAMVYVTTAQDYYQIPWAHDSVLVVRTALTYSKIVLFGAYGLLALICAGVLQKFDIEPIYAQVLCCACRYMSRMMIIFLCANVRLMVDREDNGKEDEDLSGIKYDGYLCFK